MAYRPTQADVVPFWQRLNDFFVYPFQIGPMIILGLAVLSSLILSPGLISGLLLLFLAMVQIKYGFKVIATMTEGRFQAPSLLETAMEGGYSVVIKQFVIVAFMLAATIGVIVQVAPAVGLLLGVFFLLALPMSTIILAMEESMTMALNPVVLVASMRRIGWPYLLAYLYLLMMFGSSAAFASLVFDYLGEGAVQVIGSASGYYFSLVMYSLMGYLIYQYRQELQLGPVGDDMAVNRAASGENPRIHVLLQQGEYDKALDLLVIDWKSQTRPLAMMEKYIKAARFTRSWAHVRTHLAALLQRLMGEGHPLLMVGLLRDLFKAEPGTEIKEIGQAIAVAESLREAGDSELAARVLKVHCKGAPTGKLRKRAVELMVEILESDLDQPAVAARYRVLLEEVGSRPRGDGYSLSFAEDR